ncbi:MAG: hypothetical protein JOY90_21350 [Bradyrhizobium sp.]|uniref:hypothetical protein n=1 Tax=Bradyrhizobium sp. TaxID=376 RepID=UPI001D63049E|nr:hypothetical protein [Bradyrhizobium sp.]MBV9562962.1 hypothetical protein [Bradyrhizobium sp.]
MACCLVGAGAAAAAEAAPDTRNGRYALQPSGDGMVRLDTHTGEVSTCSNSAAGWACYAVPDERKAMDTEIGRLQAENERLKAQLAARDMGKGDLGKGDLGKGEALPKTADSDRKLTIPLPSDQDIDRAMALIEQTWRRLVDMASRVQKDVAGKI